MSLVGKQMDHSEEKDENDNEMSISTRKVFEEKTKKQLSEEVMGWRLDPFVNSRLAWKQFVLSFLIWYFLLNPIIDTYVE